jgi:hypothetical protein
MPIDRPDENSTQPQANLAISPDYDRNHLMNSTRAGKGENALCIQRFLYENSRNFKRQNIMLFLANKQESQ